MFPFTDKVPCKKKSAGTNAIKYIILHHTGSLNYKGDLNVLSGNTNRDVSCHFLIGPEGQSAKIGDPTEIQWHVGVSERGTEKRIGGSLNRCCVGIEVTGPGSDGKFTPKQKELVKLLTEHLMAVYKIPHDYVLRHCDLTHPKSKEKQYRKIGVKGRKRDLSYAFFPGGDFLAWRETLIPKMV